MMRKLLYVVTIIGLIGCTVLAQVRAGRFSTLSTTGAATFGGAVSGAAATFSGVFTDTAFGTHNFSAGGTGPQILALTNTTSGTTNYAELALVGGTSRVLIDAFSQGFTSANYSKQSGGALYADGAGGLSLVAAHASGAHRFYAGGSADANERMRLWPSGGLSVGFAAVAVDPGDGIVSFGSPTSAQALNLLTTTGAPGITMPSGSWGAGGNPGSTIALGYNTAGSGAAGYVNLYEKDGTSTAVWSDATTVLRISTAAPTANGVTSDTSGTIVGTQTSTRDTKTILGRVTDHRAALDAILQTPVYRFRYKGGQYGGSVFTGVMSEDLPAVMMDADAKHPSGRSFSPVSAFGLTASAIRALQQEIDTLRAEVAALKRARR